MSSSENLVKVPVLAANIAMVERETGLSKDTLRVWERRYGFPSPSRDSNGERLYPADQVEKLRVIRRLMDQGMRPGKIVAAPLAELTTHMHAMRVDDAVTPPETDAAAALFQLITEHKSAQLRESLSMLLARAGLQRFVLETVVPLNVAVGDAWAQGRIAIYEEHLYTEQIQHLLRQAVGSISHAGQRPRVLLTTLPGEEHLVGLLMAQACLVVDGAQCLSLGVQTPATDIALAAKAHHVDIVGLSFSAAIPLHAALPMLAGVRQLLDPAVALWAGGSIWQRARRQVEGTLTLATLTDIPAALAQWRATH